MTDMTKSPEIAAHELAEILKGCSETSDLRVLLARSDAALTEEYDRMSMLGSGIGCGGQSREFRRALRLELIRRGLWYGRFDL